MQREAEKRTSHILMQRIHSEVSDIFFQEFGVLKANEVGQLTIPSNSQEVSIYTAGTTQGGAGTKYRSIK